MAPIQWFRSKSLVIKLASGNGEIDMAYKFFEVKKDEGVGIVTMNRPPANAISSDFIEEMKQVIEEAGKNEGIRCVLFRSGIEKFFSAGFDLGDIPAEVVQEYVSCPQSETSRKLVRAIMDRMGGVLKEIQKTYRTVEEMKKPTIACINGHALGGGLELALSCDFRFMGRSSRKIGLPEVTLGLMPFAGGTQRLPRLIGKSKAMELMLNGTRIGADEAFSLGIINKVFDEEKVGEETLSYAKTLAAGATRAMCMIKECVNNAFEMKLSEGLRIESDAFQVLSETEDLIEGVLSFIERRKPKYSGK